ELSHEPDLRLQPLAEPVFDGRLNVRNQPTNVGGRRSARVHDDVRVQVRDHRAAYAESLQAALVDKATCSNVLDLLEDRAGARKEREPGMLGAPPLEVFPDDLLELRAAAEGQLKGR